MEELRFSHMTIWRVLHERLYYLYRSQLQGLMMFQGENFCRSFVQRSAEYFFVSSVFFKDGTCFGRYIINVHNQHHWAKENHYDVIHSRQQLFSTVWAGIVVDCLVGSNVLPHQLTGNHYRDFLLHNLLKLLEDVLLAQDECGICTYMMVLLYILIVLC
jgi:hypothetical protein